jgi:RNA polymerase sigma-70 factor (ECF subfamily)
VLANQRRSHVRRDRLAVRLRAQPARLPDVEQAVLGGIETQAVLDALHRLGDGDREVLLLAAWEGLSNAEIGAVLDCSENAAALRLHRARKRLAQICAKEAAEAGDTGVRRGTKRPRKGDV